MRYFYSVSRVFENPGNLEDITSKQIRYIEYLAGRELDDGEKLADILASIGTNVKLSELNRGQASFVIKCFLGEIRTYGNCAGCGIKTPMIIAVMNEPSYNNKKTDQLYLCESCLSNLQGCGV
jgi:hypothetical protein